MQYIVCFMVTGGISVEADSPEEAREYFESEGGQEAVAMCLQPEVATITEITEGNDEDLDAESCVLVCEDCESTDCAYNSGGVCKFPMVFGREPKKTEEDGCTEGVIDLLPKQKANGNDSAAEAKAEAGYLLTQDAAEEIAGAAMGLKPDEETEIITVYEKPSDADETFVYVSIRRHPANTEFGDGFTVYITDRHDGQTSFDVENVGYDKAALVAKLLEIANNSSIQS